jgi:hypothetical protein
MPPWPRVYKDSPILNGIPEKAETRIDQHKEEPANAMGRRFFFGGKKK